MEVWSKLWAVEHKPGRRLRPLPRRPAKTAETSVSESLAAQTEEQQQKVKPPSLTFPEER